MAGCGLAVGLGLAAWTIFNVWLDRWWAWMRGEIEPVADADTIYSHLAAHLFRGGPFIDDNLADSALRDRQCYDPDVALREMVNRGLVAFVEYDDPRPDAVTPRRIYFEVAAKPRVTKP